MLLQRVAACNEETAKRNVQIYRERYRSTKSDHKALLLRSIMEVIRNQWVHVDVGEVKALPKTSQALCEGATTKDESLNSVSVASVPAGLVDNVEQSTQPSQEEIHDKGLRWALQTLPYRRVAKKSPVVVSSQPRITMIAKVFGASNRPSSRTNTR